MTLKNNRSSLLCYLKLCATFHSHRWIQTGVTVRKCPIWVKIWDFFLCDFEIWWVTLKNNRAPPLCYFKLGASFHSHRWIKTGVTVRKLSNGGLTSVTLTFDLRPGPFAWTSLLSIVICLQNIMMLQWCEHSEKGVTDGLMDRQTDWTICRAVWSQLKTGLLQWTSLASIQR